MAVNHTGRSVAGSAADVFYFKDRRGGERGAQMHTERGHTHLYGVNEASAGAAQALRFLPRSFHLGTQLAFAACIAG